MPKVSLSELLTPLKPEAFFKAHWPGTALFLPAVKGKLHSLLGLPQLRDLEALLAARVLKVRACLPDFNDEYSSIFVDPADARKAYRNGMTLVFDGMHTENSFLADTLRNIRTDLGLPNGGDLNDLSRARVMGYATPAGGHTSLHFDANANFVVQLKGTKRWGLAPNTSVENPTDRYTAGTGELPIALERQCQAMLLDELPQEHLEFVMEPGCVLFVPRGYWHETATEEDSLSLNFTFGQPTWADIATLSLREHLFQTAVWRELADGLDGVDCARTEKAVAHFETLLKKLAQHLPNVSARQLLSEAGFLKEPL